MELSESWRACVADDEVRRVGIGLDHIDDGWPQVPVPGHWRCTPEFGASDGPLLYRHRFDLEPPAAGRRRFVTLEGVFYQADVWLDGAYLGDPEGYFFPHSFEITGLSRLAREHVLAVEVSCSPQRQRAAKRNITGVFQHSDTIDQDWNPGGLWRPVRIEETGEVRIDRLRVLCRDANDARAHLRIHVRLDSDFTRTVTLRTSVTDPKSSDKKVIAEHSRSVAGGMNEVDWDVDVYDPELWWPWSLGPQPLTDVTVQVLIQRNERTDSEASDSRTLRIGLREVAMVDWVLSVNGERLFSKGANLAPTRAAPAEATPAEVRRDIELARDAGLDLVRLRGHIGRPELYDAADELGMMVWQDFPLQWGYTRTIRRQAVRQAREAVDALGHHPSIVLWCAHNDPSPTIGSGAGVAGKSILGNIARQQLPGWNRTILDRWVKRAFEAADETRPVIAHSGVAPHLPRGRGTDSHLSFGWHHGDLADLDGFAASMPQMTQFVSEFGAQSVPASASFMHEENWPELDWNGLARHHGLQLQPLAQLVPPADYDRFDDWRTATQHYQAEVLRHYIETLRRLKYRPTGGFCFLSLNDPAPAVSWSVLDHERQPKLAYQAVIEACRPVIVVAERMRDALVAGEAVALDVHVISDLRVPLDDVRCTAKLRWPGGGHEWQWSGSIPTDSCVRVGTVQFVVPNVAGALWFDLTLEHPHAAATNRYATTVIDRPNSAARITSG
ncbi:MAG: hypothetical protein HY826_08005 [Actinobacteria bacterium]|nr:hypothetical protein [Actinomycetota bacterium]